MKQKGLEVILFGPTIEFDVPLPRLLALSLRDRKPAMVDARFDITPVQIDEKLAEVARNKWKISYISVFENLCASKVKMEDDSQTISGCPIYAARNVPLLFDTDHFTREGSILFARTMKDRNQLP